MSAGIMSNKVLQFFLVKIIIGVAVVGGLVAFSEWSLRLLFSSSAISDVTKYGIISVTDIALAMAGYIVLFRFYEKRKISELSIASFGKNAAVGFLTGVLLQSAFILVIYLAASYTIKDVNPVSSLLPSLTTAINAGFIAEILLRGILFRITEEALGTVIALLIQVVLFTVMHINVPGGNLLSLATTVVQAGLLLPAAFVLTRSLWFPIFLHFAWDFIEPGIFGAVNPGNNVGGGLFTSSIQGPWLITGAQMGPQNSLQAFIFCSTLTVLFLWIAKKRNNFIRPSWKNK